MILLALLLLLFAQPLLPQQPFASRCAACHGENARGTAKAPGLAMNPRVAEQSVEQLRGYLERGNPGAGMPAFGDLPAGELTSLGRYLRRINADTILMPVAAAEPTAKVTWGAPQPGDWLTYNGSDSGNRYSALDQIRTTNVSSLKLKWVFPIPYFGLETTHAGRIRRALCHRPEPGVRHRREHRQSAVALFTSPKPGAGGRCKARHQPRRCHSRRQGLLRDRQRPPAGQP